MGAPPSVAVFLDFSCLRDSRRFPGSSRFLAHVRTPAAPTRLHVDALTTIESVAARDPSGFHSFHSSGAPKCVVMHFHLR